MIRKDLAALCLAVVALVAGCSSETPPPPGPAPEGGRPFADSSFWNTPLDADAPLDPASDAITADLRRQVEAYGAWMNTDRFSTPVYVVPDDAPTVAVSMGIPDPKLQSRVEAVPIPETAVPARGTDRHLVIWQPGRDVIWEFWQAARAPGGPWTAQWGGRLDRVSASDGVFAAPYGASATGLAMIGGMVLLDEARAGRIDHAIALAVPEVRANVIREPAQRGDGTSDSSASVPEGARFRLDPALDLDSLDLPPFTRMLADAAQTYGIVVRDVSGVVSFYGEDPLPTGSGAFENAFGGLPPSEIAGAFPWEHLQLLPPLADVKRG